MLSIGEFRKNNKGLLEGIVFGLGIAGDGVLVSFVPNPDKQSNQPDFQLQDRYYHIIGHAWAPKAGKEHYYVKFESPWMPMPVVDASLFPPADPSGIFNLIWYAPRDNAPKAVVTVDTKVENGNEQTAAGQKRRFIRRAHAATP